MSHDSAALLLDLARTAIDVGREHGYRHGLVACDAARRLGVRRADLERAHAIMDNWPRIRPARAAVRDSVAGVETLGETLTRELIDELGLGLPVITQFPVLLSDRRIARARSARGSAGRRVRWQGQDPEPG